MPNSILDGLSLVDSTGRLILATTVTTLLLGIGANLVVRGKYTSLQTDLEENAGRRRFSHAVLDNILRSTEDTFRRSSEASTQAIIEAHFQSDLRPLLLAERFVRAATGLVIILGLLGTFYGLTSSIGKLVQLIAGDAGGITDVAQGVTTGLAQALSGMAVAFSNSLVGIASAVILTVLGVFSNVTDRRVALMTRIETYIDRLRSDPAPNSTAGTGATRLERTVAGFGESVERLDVAVANFEFALQAFSTSTRDFTEFNAHLRDNVQRMSLTFGDLADTLRSHVVASRRVNGQ
jgi:hypothetical protein